MIPIVIASLIDKTGNIIHLMARFWGKIILYLSKVKVEVIGSENIINNGPQIFVANHQSNYDVFTLIGYLRVQFRLMVKKELFKIPILGFGMSRCGYISIDRQNPQKAASSIKHAAKRIGEGTSVIFFPEGTRSLDGNLKEFKRGGFILALKSKVPIVPISIVGSFSVLPPNHIKPKPGTIRLIIDKPIETNKLSLAEKKGLSARAREVIKGNIERYSN